MILQSLGEKGMYPPPPPYSEIASSWRPPPPAFTSRSHSLSVVTGLDGPSSTRNLKLSTLPSHVLLQIVYCTFPQSAGQFEGEGKVELQRATLFWLETSLRLVNKAFYTTCMHILRSTYVPAYDSLIRPPYTSDPFFSPYPGYCDPNRELATLDQFIALLAHEEVLLDSSSLYLPREEAYKDLFDLSQPRSRLEDLVHYEGIKAGIFLSEVPAVEESRTPTSPSPVSPPSSPIPSVSAVSTSHTVPESVKPCRQHSPNGHTNEQRLSSDGGREIYLLPPSPSPSNLSYPTPVPSPSPTKSSFKLSSFVSSFREKHHKKEKHYNKKPPPPTPFISEPPPPPISLKQLPFGSISISFSPRIVKLLYSDLPQIAAAGPSSPHTATFSGSEFGSLSMSGVSHGARKRRPLVEITRAKDETLEASARRLVHGLRDVLEDEMLL